jgi:hypothetical protein
LIMQYSIPAVPIGADLFDISQRQLNDIQADKKINPGHQHNLKSHHLAAILSNNKNVFTGIDIGILEKIEEALSHNDKIITELKTTVLSRNDNNDDNVNIHLYSTATVAVHSVDSVDSVNLKAFNTTKVREQLARFTPTIEEESIRSSNKYDTFSRSDSSLYPTQFNVKDTNRSYTKGISQYHPDIELSLMSHFAAADINTLHPELITQLDGLFNKLITATQTGGLETLRQTVLATTAALQQLFADIMANDPAIQQAMQYAAELLQTAQQSSDVLLAQVHQQVSGLHSAHQLRKNLANTIHLNDLIADAKFIARNADGSNIDYSGMIDLPTPQLAAAANYAVTEDFHTSSMGVLITLLLSFLALSELYGQLLLTTTKFMNKNTKIAQQLNQTMNAFLDMATIIPYYTNNANGAPEEVTDLYELFVIAFDPDAATDGTSSGGHVYGYAYDPTIASSLEPFLQIVDPSTGEPYFDDCAFDNSTGDRTLFNADLNNLLSDINYHCLDKLSVPYINPFPLDENNNPTIDSAALGASLQGLETGLTNATSVSTNLQVVMQAQQLAYTQAIKMSSATLSTMKDIASYLYR